ncbi:DUF502 domain-containing protein [Glaciecola sp. XM2]|uniref:DUF502 domain-containing protein n=1 Tax=Glaciecola sp. XM2 TaxID=1914931 RepID=UPI001BDE7746|nr:DUF502 domain-containing protein [Glaciecola sp. XM2]MBT1450345.1 DUF502 domain-containing protein [Glaciecola sp. XM2]
MLNKFLLLIFKGLITILPLALTVYLLYWLTTSIESTLSPYFSSSFYFPGLGIVTTLLALAGIGIVVNAYIVRSILEYSDRFMERLPLVKTLYGAIQDAVHLFKASKEKEVRKPVTVEVSPDVHVVGFVTNVEVASKLFPEQEKVPVYLPLSYQIGGYTLYVPKDKITELDIDVETAMRIAVTGGSSIQSSNTTSKPS